MDKYIIWTCVFCHINPSNQSSRKCPRCGRKLTPWDLSKEPLERKPEWPNNKRDTESDLEIPELTESQMNYIQSQQSKADTEVRNPSSPYYEPEDSKRYTAARVLMRKWEREKSRE